jgi:L-lactate dehydrogenase complex protein LldF
VLAGIDEIIANSNEIDLFFHLFSTHSEGMFSNAYMHLISGPKQSEESDGPEEMIVILLDNGRSNILAQVPQRSALSCIKCGACINVCPVYNNIGGAAYQSVFTGPIGAILTPVIKGMEDYKFLNYASTSGMEAVSECPVKINFPKLIQSNRTNSVKEQPAGKTEKLALFFWKTAMLKRSNMDKGGMKLKNFMLRQFFKKSWGERREIPLVANKSFNQLWRERKGIK